MAAAQQPQTGTRPLPAGFSLIEVMVALSISVLALLATAPLTSSWVDSAKVNETLGLMQQGYARTKAIAQRNILGAADNGVAASLCRAGNTLYVYAGLQVGACGSGSIVWQGRIPGDTGMLIQNSGNTFSCLAMNSRAQAVSASINDSACDQGNQFTASKGGQSVTRRLY